MINNTISITVQAPELISAIIKLTEAITGKPVIADITPLPLAEITDTTTNKTETTETTFDEIHAVLINLKQKQGSGRVREILDIIGCKTVQDIPPDKFAEVLQMTAGVLES